MPNTALTLEYNGSAFHGWQKQPELKTVQSELERVLTLILREPVSLHASGRTDAGVHARGQVVSFKTEKAVDLYRLAQSVNGLLKPDLAVVATKKVSENFSAGRDAEYKQYSYKILRRKALPVLDNGFVWHVPGNLDLARMQIEAKALIGEYDFSSFRASDCCAKSPVKTIYESEVIEEGPYLIYRVIGSGFLKQMVRNIAGTLVNIAQGRLNNVTVQEIISAKDRKLAGVTAPACGLYLDWVYYRN